jgi:hypothetical protein
VCWAAQHPLSQRLSSNTTIVVITSTPYALSSTSVLALTLSPLIFHPSSITAVIPLRVRADGTPDLQAARVVELTEASGGARIDPQTNTTTIVIPENDLPCVASPLPIHILLPSECRGRASLTMSHIHFLVAAIDAHTPIHPLLPHRVHACASILLPSSLCL